MDTRIWMQESFWESAEKQSVKESPQENAEHLSKDQNENGGRSHHIHGIDAGGNQGRTIREGTEDGLRKQAQYDEQGDQDGVCQFESHAAGFEQAALFSRSNLVADESSCRGGKSADHHDQQGGNIADDVGNGQRAFPQMFNRQEKNKPDGDGNKRLHHGPSGNGQHSLQQMGAECECPAEAVLPFIRRHACVDDEKEKGDCFRYAGGNGRPCYACGGKAAFPENEAVI